VEAAMWPMGMPPRDASDHETLLFFYSSILLFFYSSRILARQSDICAQGAPFWVHGNLKA
jgi:hypothetical protein